MLIFQENNLILYPITLIISFKKIYLKKNNSLLEKNKKKLDKNINDKNILYNISNNIIKCEKIFENQSALSFDYEKCEIDLNKDDFDQSNTKNNNLIISKKEYLNFYDFHKNATEKEIIDYWDCFKNTIDNLKLKNDNFRIISNCNTYGNQKIKHYNFYLLYEDIGPTIIPKNNYKSKYRPATNYNFNKYDKNNPFFKKINDKSPKIIENDNAISFYDDDPRRKIHVQIIPKGEYLNIYDFIKNAKNKEKLDFFKCCIDTIEKLNLVSNGFRIVSNKGSGCQSIPHLHFHLFSGESAGNMV